MRKNHCFVMNVVMTKGPFVKVGVPHRNGCHLTVFSSRPNISVILTLSFKKKKKTCLLLREKDMKLRSQEYVMT